MPARLANAVQPIVRAQTTELVPMIWDALNTAAVAGGLVAMGHNPATAYHVARQYATIGLPGVERVDPFAQRIPGMERFLGIPGISPLGIPGVSPWAAPGMRPLAAPWEISPWAAPGISPLAAPWEISPLGAPGISPLGIPGISPLGIPGISPMGIPGISPLGAPGGILGLTPGITGFESPLRPGVMGIDP